MVCSVTLSLIRRRLVHSLCSIRCYGCIHVNSMLFVCLFVCRLRRDCVTTVWTVSNKRSKKCAVTFQRTYTVSDWQSFLFVCLFVFMFLCSGVIVQYRRVCYLEPSLAS